jgi:hypothetical protein
MQQQQKAGVAASSSATAANFLSYEAGCTRLLAAAALEEAGRYGPALNC